MVNVQTTSFWRGRLPHWEVAGASYFVTLRLAGCLPHHVQTELETLLADVSESDWLQRARAYFVKVEQWLDRHADKTWLTQPEVAAIVSDALHAYERAGVWRLHAWVLMPNHAHWFFTPMDRSVRAAMHGFKRFTAREAKRVLGLEGQRFWQIEWFDHWSRSPMESDRIIAYIRRNPVKAGLVDDWQKWKHVG